MTVHDRVKARNAIEDALVKAGVDSWKAETLARTFLRELDRAGYDIVKRPRTS